MPTNTNTSTETPEAESATGARGELKDALQKAIDEKLAEKRKPDGTISHEDRIEARKEAREALRRDIEAHHQLPAEDPTKILSEAEKAERSKAQAEAKAKMKAEFDVIGINERDSTFDTVKDHAAATTETLFSENLSEGQKVAVTAGLAGVATVGVGALLWKWWNSGKERVHTAVDAGQQAAAKSEGGLFKKIMIGAGVGLGLFFGIPKLDQFFHQFDWYKNLRQRAKDAITEKKDAIKEKVKDKVENAKQKVEDAKNSEAGKEVKEGVEKIVIHDAPSVLLQWFGDEAEEIGFTDIYDSKTEQALSHVLGKIVEKDEKLGTLLTKNNQEEYTVYYNHLFGTEQVSDDIRKSRIKSIRFLQKVIQETSSSQLQESLTILHEQYPEKWPENLEELSIKNYIHLIYIMKLQDVSLFTKGHLEGFMQVLKGGNAKDLLGTFINESKEVAKDLGEYEWAVLTKDYPNRKNLQKKEVLKGFCDRQLLLSGSFADKEKMNEYDKEFLEQQREKMKQKLCRESLSPDIEELCLNDPQIIAALQSRKEYISFSEAMRLSIALEQGNSLAGMAAILNIISSCSPDVFSVVSFRYAQWMGSNILSVLLSDAKSLMSGGVNFDDDSIPPNLRRIAKLIRRRTYHEAMVTLESTGVVGKELASNKYVYVGGGIAGAAYTGSLYWWINRNGDFSAVGNRAGGWGRGATKTTLHYGLGILSDYHHTVGVSSGDLTQNIDELMNLVMKDINGGKIKNLLDDFIHLEQTEKDWEKLIKRVRIILKNDNHDILTKLKEIKNVHAKGFKHYSQWFGSRLWQNTRNILNTDPKYARTRNISRLEKIFNPDPNELRSVNSPYKNLTANQRKGISDLLKNSDLDNAELHFLKDSKKAQKVFLEIVDTTDNATKALKMKELKSVLQSAAKISAVLKGVGVIGDIFDIANQMHQNALLAEERKTASPERRMAIDQKLQEAWKRYAVNGGVLGATAIETAIAYKMGLGVMGSLGYSSAALGPGMIVIGGMLIMTDSANEMALSMSREYRDYYQKSEQELLALLDDHPNRSTWSQWWNKDFSMSEDSFKSGNETHRSEIFRAYIAKNLNIQQWPGESVEDFTRRHSEIVSATILSLSRQKSPDGKFINLSPDILRDAKLDGELTTLSQRLIQEEESDELTTEEKAFVMVRGTDGKERKVFLSQYANIVDAEDGKTSTYEGVAQPFTRKDVRNAFQNNREKINMKQLFDIAKESKMSTEQLQKIMTAKALGECTDDIHFLSHAFMSFDYSGLFGWDEEMKNACLNLAERKIATIILGEVQAYCDDRTEENFVDLYQETLKSIRNRMKQVSPESLNEELNQLKQQNIFDAFKMRDLGKMPITPESIAQRMNEKEGKKVAEKKEAESGEKSIFTIEELKKQRVVEKKGDMYVKDAKGYRFVRVVNNSILCTEENDVIITSDDPEKIPHGTYAIFGPTETPNRNEPSTLGKFSFRNAYSDEERSVREATLNYRLKQGILRLEAAGAKKISQYCYSVNKDIQGTVIYYFDRSRMEWNITSFDSDSNLTFEQYGASYNELPKGIDPATVFSKEHVETARAMQDINQQKPATPKKAPAPSPSNPPITQPPPVISA